MELKLPQADAEKCASLLIKLDIAAAYFLDIKLNKKSICNEMVLKLRLFWQNTPDFIENFINASGDDLSEEDRKILRGWKGATRGRYIVGKYCPDYFCFFSFENEMFYGVLGLGNSIPDLLNQDFPLPVEAVLLPYKGRIIYDGFLGCSDIRFPEDLSAAIIGSCDYAYEQGMIITELESAGDIMVSLMSSDMGAKKFTEWFESEKYPALALHMALEHKDISVPCLLELLDDVLENYQTIDVERHDFVIALYVLAKMREPLAFERVIKFAKLPDGWVEKLLEDVISESLARFIVSTYNGNLSAIKEVIEDESLNVYCRSAAVTSLLGLIACEKISRSEGIEYFRALLGKNFKNKDFIAFLVCDACSLDPRALASEIQSLFDNDMIEQCVIDEDDFHEDCLLSEDELKEKLLTCKHYSPIEDLDEALNWLYQGEGHDEDNFEIHQTVYNNEKIGRNEQCPCESGKKYKRCCL